MCTAISYGRFFGRNLDWTENFGEKVVITPRKFPFKFRQTPEIKEHFAIIGTAVCENNYPLYFDAANECGLCAAEGRLCSDYGSIRYWKEYLAEVAVGCIQTGKWNPFSSLW